MSHDHGRCRSSMIGESWQWEVSVVYNRWVVAMGGVFWRSGIRRIVRPITIAWLSCILCNIIEILWWKKVTKTEGGKGQANGPPWICQVLVTSRFCCAMCIEHLYLQITSLEHMNKGNAVGSCYIGGYMWMVNT